MSVNAWLCISLLLVAPLSGERAPHPSAVPRLRTTDGLVSAAVIRGVARSPTFRALVARLQASDLVVHVVRRPGGTASAGVTQFVTATPYARYVRITLAAGDGGDPMVALLGHELQHAVEVAEAGSVRDDHAFGALYRTIGEPSCALPRRCFDTARAVEAGRDILEELRHRPGGRWVRAKAARQEDAP